MRRDPATRSGASRRVGEQLGITPETLRNRVQQAEIDEGHRLGVTRDEARRIGELKVHAELRGQGHPVITGLAVWKTTQELPERLPPGQPGTAV